MLRNHIVAKRHPSDATAYTRDQAERVAEQNSAQDSEWRYLPITWRAGERGSVVEVYDEDENFLGYL